MSKAVAVAAGWIVIIALAPSTALATAGLVVDPAVPAEASSGLQNVAAAIVITNANTGPDNSTTLCNFGDPGICAGANGISVIPSCRSANFAGICLTPDLDVFHVDSPATGAAGTACAAMSFDVALADAGTGELRLTPTSGHVVLPQPGATCRIELTLDVLRYPEDADAGEPGRQTIQIAQALGSSDQNTTAFARGWRNVTIKALVGISANPSADVPLGGAVQDTMSLEDELRPTGGSVTFRLYGPNDDTCSRPARHEGTVPIDVTGTATSPAFTPTQAGTYRWVVAYSGDEQNIAVTSGCTSLNEVVVSAQPSAPVTTPSTTGRPAPCFDCDLDGFTASVDCDDHDSGVHPGAVDAPGNVRDEDCSGRDAPYPRLGSTVVYAAERSRRFTRFHMLYVRDAPAGSTVRASCAGRGCRMKAHSRKVRRDAPRVNLLALVRGARLRSGAQIEITVTKPGTIGVARRIIVRAAQSVRVLVLCVPPGKRRPSRCGSPARASSSG